MSIPVDADLSIFGKISRYNTQVTLRERSQILGTCFGGLGMFNCISEEQGLDPNNYNTPYYDHINELKGQPYCTQCCGTNPNHIDDWNMFCPVDSIWESNLQSILYIGAEFRFARRNTLADLEFITCPLRSNACNYSDTGETLSCDVNYAGIEYIVGYELDVRVQQHQANWKYWRGVTSCSAVSITRSTPLAQGEWFQETMHINRKYNPQPVDLGQVGIILALVLFVWFIACYFCRRDICLVCQSRLIIFFNRCWICRLFGAHVPDPILLQALATKGEIIQMESERPERFPGAKFCTAACRCIWKWLTCKCCEKTKIAAYDTTRDLSHILDASPEPPPTTCCRDPNEPDVKSIFEVCCCCLISCYDCCFKEKGGKVKKIRVIELPLQPYQIYDAIRHMKPPQEVVEAKEEDMAIAKMREDLELYGDLTAKIAAADEPKPGTAESDALRRMTIFKQSGKLGAEFLQSGPVGTEVSGKSKTPSGSRRGSTIGAGPAPSLRRGQASFSSFADLDGISRSSSKTHQQSGLPSIMPSPASTPAPGSTPATTYNAPVTNVSSKPSFFRSFSSSPPPA